MNYKISQIILKQVLKYILTGEGGQGISISYSSQWLNQSYGMRSKVSIVILVLLILTNQVESMMKHTQLVSRIWTYQSCIVARTAVVVTGWAASGCRQRSKWLLCRRRCPH